MSLFPAKSSISSFCSWLNSSYSLSLFFRIVSVFSCSDLYNPIWSFKEFTSESPLIIDSLTLFFSSSNLVNSWLNSELFNFDNFSLWVFLSFFALSSSTSIDLTSCSNPLISFSNVFRACNSSLLLFTRSFSSSPASNLTSAALISASSTAFLSLRLMISSSFANFFFSKSSTVFCSLEISA